MIQDENDELNAASLSQAGMNRRERMLDELTQSMNRLHRRRRAMRSATVGAGLIALGMALIASFSTAFSGQRSGAPEIAHHPQPVDANSAHNEPAPAIEALRTDAGAIIAYVQTDPTIVERWRAAAANDVPLLDDEELLDALAQIGRPSGLIRVDGRAWLSRSVVDEQWRADEPDAGGSS